MSQVAANILVGNSAVAKLRTRVARFMGAGKISEDARWIDQVQKGNREAFQYLVEKYQARAFSLAFDILRSQADAEDVVQESFVKAFLSLNEFRGEASFYTWFYRIVYNMSLDYRRKLVRRSNNHTKPLNEEAEEVEFSSPGPQEIALSKERFQELKQALAELSEEHRTVITLREIDGLSYDEIARVVGISKGTVMSRLHYARRRIQRALGGNVDINESEEI